MLVTICSSATLIAQIAIAIALGYRLYGATLFFGPKVLSIKLHGFRFILRTVPLSSVIYLTPMEEDYPAGAELEWGDDVRRVEAQLANRSLSAKCAVNMGGVIGLLFISECLLGWTNGLKCMVNGFLEILWGAANFEYGHALGRIWFETLSNSSLAEQLGILSAKLATLNLLPFPFFAGGQLLSLLYESAFCRGEPNPPSGPRPATGHELMALFVLFVFYLRWGYILYFAV
ncbi:MAG: hypothetical protein M5U26_14165 [Planctomycetota bacterium]|nr:hypothetical protein [Planctomycetota bacterium]